MKIRKNLCLLSTLKLKLKFKEITSANFDSSDFVCIPYDSTSLAAIARNITITYTRGYLQIFRERYFF